MLRLTNFQKAYAGGPPVLTVPALTLTAGLHWVRGVNGAGKTTLFRAVAGLLPLTAGEIWLNETAEVRRHPVAYRRLVSYAEAEPLLPAALTGHELAAFVAKARQAPDPQLRALAEALGVAAYWHTPTAAYSSGMTKKLALLLALLGEETRLILLDEPLVTLDTAAVATLTELIRARLAGGTAFLLASHQELAVPWPAAGQWRVAGGTISPETL